MTMEFLLHPFFMTKAEDIASSSAFIAFLSVCQFSTMLTSFTLNTSAE